MSNIELKNLSKIYGNHFALHDVSLCFEKNKIYGLLGRNGAGKSSMLNVISNRAFPSSGEVLIDGEMATENDSALSKVYCISEKNIISPNLKFKKAIDQTKFFYPDFDVDYALKLAEKFGLDINKKLSDFSTGYNSIAKIILALSCNAEYVLLDEPILGLDANHRELFYKELLQKYIDDGGTFIISTHLIDECVNLFEKVVIINNGQIVADTDTETLLEGYYTISGNAILVDEYCKEKDVIGIDTIGGLKSAYIKGKAYKIPDGLEVSKASLQNIFVQLTNSDK